MWIKRTEWYTWRRCCQFGCRRGESWRSCRYRTGLGRWRPDQQWWEWWLKPYVASTSGAVDAGLFAEPTMDIWCPWWARPLDLQIWLVSTWVCLCVLGFDWIGYKRGWGREGAREKWEQRKTAVVILVEEERELRSRWKKLMREREMVRGHVIFCFTRIKFALVWSMTRQKIIGYMYYQDKKNLI